MFDQMVVTNTAIAWKRQFFMGQVPGGVSTSAGEDQCLYLASSLDEDTYLQVHTPTLSSILAGKLDNITATRRGGTPIVKWILNPTAWSPSGSIIQPICCPSILNFGFLYKSPLHAGMVHSVYVRRVVLI